MSGHHLTEIGLPAYSFAFGRLLGLVLDGPVCNQTPLGGQIGWIDIRGGHVGEKLDVDGGFFYGILQNDQDRGVSRSVWTNKD